MSIISDGMNKVATQTNNTPLHIGFSGCGNIGGALLRGNLRANPNNYYAVITPNSLRGEFQGQEQIAHHKTPAVSPELDVLILAVKPQIMDKVCQDWAPHISKNTIVVSVAAGKTLDYFQGYFGENQPIIRAMPNTPAAIGKGITVGVANKNVSTEQKALVTKIMSTAGEFDWVHDESLINAVTAISGSGPAYIFHMVEAMTAAAKNLGLPDQLAEKLAWNTVVGSGALLESNPEISAAQLRKNVTSPNGTTEAGLKVLKPNLTPLIIDTTKAARDRGMELGKPVTPTIELKID